jgi:hypothetical protein
MTNGLSPAIKALLTWPSGDAVRSQCYRPFANASELSITANDLLGAPRHATRRRFDLPRT